MGGIASVAFTLVSGVEPKRELLAPRRSRTPPSPPEKSPESIQVGESLTTRLTEQSDENTRGGQGISVSPVAIRDIDPVMACNLVEIPAPQPRKKPARHPDRAQALDVGNLADGIGQLATDPTPVEARIVRDENPALESLQNI